MALDRPLPSHSLPGTDDGLGDLRRGTRAVVVVPHPPWRRLRPRGRGTTGRDRHDGRPAVPYGKPLGRWLSMRRSPETDAWYELQRGRLPHLVAEHTVEAAAGRALRISQITPGKRSSRGAASNGVIVRRLVAKFRPDRSRKSTGVEKRHLRDAPFQQAADALGESHFAEESHAAQDRPPP